MCPEPRPGATNCQWRIASIAMCPGRRGRVAEAKVKPGHCARRFTGSLRVAAQTGSTVTNLQAITYAATVMTVLLTKGVLRAWVFPDQLAFVQTSVCVAELAADAAVTQVPRAPTATSGASASVSPQPLDPSSLE